MRRACEQRDKQDSTRIMALMRTDDAVNGGRGSSASGITPSLVATAMVAERWDIRRYFAKGSTKVKVKAS